MKKYRLIMQQQSESLKALKKDFEFFLDYKNNPLDHFEQIKKSQQKSTADIIEEEHEENGEIVKKRVFVNSKMVSNGVFKQYIPLQDFNSLSEFDQQVWKLHREAQSHNKEVNFDRKSDIGYSLFELGKLINRSQDFTYLVNQKIIFTTQLFLSYNNYSVDMPAEDKEKLARKLKIMMGQSFGRARFADARPPQGMSKEMFKEWKMQYTYQENYLKYSDVRV